MNFCASQGKNFRLINGSMSGLRSAEISFSCEADSVEYRNPSAARDAAVQHSQELAIQQAQERAEKQTNLEMLRIGAALLGPTRTGSISNSQNTGGSPTAPATCPIGSFPSMDMFGNKICQGGSGHPVTAEVNLATGCPNGAFLSIDNFGNRVCKSMDNKTIYYDTSHGCPIGTHLGMDMYGNQACQRN